MLQIAVREAAAGWRNPEICFYRGALSSPARCDHSLRHLATWCMVTIPVSRLSTMWRLRITLRPGASDGRSSDWRSDRIIASPVSVWGSVSLVAMLGNFTFNGKHLGVSRSAGDNHSVHARWDIVAIGIFSWFRGKRPGSGRSLPGVYCATGVPPLRLWRCGERCWTKSCRPATG
ncbi:hypothetical protein LN650_00025 [Klebsiella pneumoniae subsp. pneumoniae]|nr:hypothetical protein [Klebsiella pneumoniae subsp. pneumoniae]